MLPSFNVFGESPYYSLTRVLAAASCWCIYEFLTRVCLFSYFIIILFSSSTLPQPALTRELVMV